MENLKIGTSATKTIYHPCLPYVCMSPCEAHVLRLGIFMEEDQETQKIPLNYAPEIGPEEKSHGWYLRNQDCLSSVSFVSVRESL